MTVRLAGVLPNATAVAPEPSPPATPSFWAALLLQTLFCVKLRWLPLYGVASDPAKAASWYKRAADLGNPAAMVNLGVLQAQGKGVALDPEAAVALYRKSVALGHPAGMHNLAWMLDSGKGVFALEHEVRSLHHPMFHRFFVNRDPTQLQRNYKRGRDAFIPFAS